MTPILQSPRRYLIEIVLALLLYAALVYARDAMLKLAGDPLLDKAIVLSPVLGIWLAALAMFRYYGSVDEYQRLILLKIFAASAALTVAIVASWSFIEDAGVPPLSSDAVLGVFWGLLAVTAILQRRADVMDSGSTVKKIAWAVLVAGTLAFAYKLAADWQGWPALPLVLTVPCLAAVVWIGMQAFSAKGA